MEPKYFEGQDVTGKVRASSAQNFREFVERLNVCPQLPLTHKAFMALSKAERQQKKHVPYFTPCVFDQSPSPRTTEHALHCNLVCLDLDEAPDGKCPAAPFVRNPELLYTALEGLNFAAHTTASSTPEKPRMRIIVDADRISLADYPNAVRTVAAMLGLSVLTKESLVPVQPLFLPTQFKGDTEENHPLLAQRIDTAPLRSSAISSDTPDFYKVPTQHKNGSNGTVDDLDFLRAQVPEVTLAVAKDALAAIDPDIGYEEWFNMAAALRHQFSPHHAEEAYEIFDEWSATGTKYGGDEETRKKWNSLKPTPHGRQPITIHTLLKMATQAGWDDSRLKEKQYGSFSDWLEQVDSINILMSEGVKKVLSIPQIGSTQEGMLLDQIRVCAKERFQHRASMGDLRKDAARLREKMKTPEQKKKKSPQWASGLCFVTVPKLFYRPQTGEKFTTDSFNLKYARKLLPNAKSLIEAGMPVNEANLSRPLVLPTDYVLNYLQIPVFYDFAYAPAQPNEMLFVYEGRKYVNTYAPTYPELDLERADEAGAMFQRHLSNLIAEPEYRQTVIDFMAYQVQFPGQKIRWAVLIQGTEGAGKTYVAEVMKAVLGKRHVKTVDGTTITSGWNDWTFGYQLVVIEEVRVQGTNKHDIMNRLKPWITNDDIPVNEKFRSSRDVQNTTNYMLFSNHHDCLALTPGDRRYFIIKSSLQARAQVLALGKGYFKELFDFLNAHPGAMRAWFSNWKISDEFSPHAQAPRTKYVDDLINDSASDLTAAVRRLIHEGDHPLVQYDIVSAKALMDILMLEEGLQRPSTQYLHQVLREEGLHCTGRHSLGGERQYVWARNGVENVVDTAAERLAKGAKNLHMELLF